MEALDEPSATASEASETVASAFEQAPTNDSGDPADEHFVDTTPTDSEADAIDQAGHQAGETDTTDGKPLVSEDEFDALVAHQRRRIQVDRRQLGWTLLCLLAAEILAKTDRDPAEHYAELEERFGSPVYERTSAPASPALKEAFKKLDANSVRQKELAGEIIETKLTAAPANGASIGGLKVTTENGWFAARPSGTEAIYKIYAESFRGPEHLQTIQAEAQEIVDGALAGAA